MNLNVKYIITLLLLYSLTVAQEIQTISVTDSIKFITRYTDKENPVVKDCKHNWLLSGTWSDSTGVLWQWAKCIKCGGLELRERVIYTHMDTVGLEFDAAKKDGVPSDVVNTVSPSLAIIKALEVEGKLIKIPVVIVEPVEEPIKP